MDPKNKYTEMQVRYYTSKAKPWKQLDKSPIRSIDHHEKVTGNFRMHNAWPDYEKFLLRGLANTKSLTCLDFACGPGRNIVKFWNNFKQIDGVDIDQTNLDNAKLWIEHNGLNPKKSTLHKCNGVDLSGIRDNAYQAIISTIAMQHICVYKVRFNYLKEFFRVLSPGGWINIQMGIGIPTNKEMEYATYFENKTDAKSTNGNTDVCVESPDQIKSDLDKIGFTKFSYNIRLTGPRPPFSARGGHPNWIFFRAKKPIPA